MSFSASRPCGISCVYVCESMCVRACVRCVICMLNSYSTTLDKSGSRPGQRVGLTSLKLSQYLPPPPPPPPTAHTDSMDSCTHMLAPAAAARMPSCSCGLRHENNQLSGPCPCRVLPEWLPQAQARKKRQILIRTFGDNEFYREEPAGRKHHAPLQIDDPLTISPSAAWIGSRR